MKCQLDSESVWKTFQYTYFRKYIGLISVQLFHRSSSKKKKSMLMWQEKKILAVFILLSD